ncbi:MAG TPA: uracil phosphoribosyltransferase [Cryomorphaceae bacterium]|nr:uracil phosphoribosyltransferase [Cryomorphaceae bacterium]
MIHELGKANSIFNQFLGELRDESQHHDRLRFRNNLQRLGEIFAYEISKDLDYVAKDIVTPLGEVTMRMPGQFPVLATVLRAGVPFHSGFLNYFDRSDSAFVSAFRKRLANDEDFKVEVEYMSSPDLEGKELIIVDPMLATGRSMVLVYRDLIKKGKPKNIHIAAVLATKEGIDNVRKNLPPNTKFWVGAIDDELTAQSYIVPGLGDAGDLSYGKK